MIKFSRNLLNSSKLLLRPLFILEIANNHMGDVEHGLQTIRDFYQVTRKFDFNFAFKFQYRNIDTFIHPDYKKRKDLKYVKRFFETRLKPTELLILKKEAQKLGYIAMCTPFDEKSVDLIEKHDYSVIKVGSCSFNDWPLLERIIKTDKPVILSTGGVGLEEIDNVVVFFQHRKKQFAIMHCVGEYPTLENNLQLNQITLLKQRYPEIPIGFSTHEEPNNFLSVQLAIAKGAQIFERHVASKTEKFEINSYSSTTSQIEAWLTAARRSLRICGTVAKKALHSKKEISDIRQFQRGVFAKQPMIKGEVIDLAKVFFAFPNQSGQLIANDLSKYKYFYSKKNIRKNEPIIEVTLVNTREKVYEIVKKIDKFIAKSGVVFPSRGSLEISHHYGIDKFYKYGLCMITCVNRDYCKKLLIMFPGQIHPVQYHKKKEETFHILYGKFIVNLNNKKNIYKPGDVVTINSKVKHGFTTMEGGIMEEISSTHYKNDSFYVDKKIILNKNRKTFVSYWRNVL